MATTGWGCSCGRLCVDGDRFCAACGGPRDKGTAVRSEAEKALFLKKSELADAQALRGVRRILREGERSYRRAEQELDLGMVADYTKFDGWFGEWLRGGTERVDHYGTPVGDQDGWDDYDDFE